MANEIVEITRSRLPNGKLQFHVLLLYQIEPIEVDGNVLILTPRTSLPPHVEDLHLVAPAWMQGFDNGQACFKERRIDQLAGESLQDLLDRARTIYAKGLVEVERERASWKHAADSYNSTP